MTDKLSEYKQYVQKNLASLRSIFAKASVGDFSEDSEIPDTDDEFAQLAMGVQVMLDVIRARITELEQEVNERKLAEEKIRHHAYHDPLTNLPNRNSLEDRFEEELIIAGENKELLSILYLNVDHFKRINDALGHNLGDILLTEFAVRVRNCLREQDFMARLGGDEFLILMPGLKSDSLSQVMLMAKKINDELEAPVRVNDKTIFMSTSVGIATFPADGDDIWSLMANADVALARAKKSGRRRHRFYNQEMNQQINFQIHLAQDLRQAIKLGQIQMHYQPVIECSTGRLVNVEALARWNHPDQGLIEAYNFIQVGEEIGVTESLGQATLELVCQDLTMWKRHNPLPIKVALNVSPRQFADTLFVEKIEETLKQTGISGHQVEFEILETLAMDNLDLTKEKFEALRKLGIDLCIDDFGIGYSSLNYLRRFPIYKLKIDKAFVANCLHDQQDASVIEAIAALGHSLGLKVVAEGVESEDHVKLLTSLGCDALQGYHIAKPMPAAELVSWLEARGIGQQLNKKNNGHEVFVPLR